LWNAIGFVAWAAENAHGFLVGGSGDEGLDGVEAGPQPNSVDLQDRSGTLGEAPTLATTRAADGVVNAAGYL
jgi:hypothetical protein